MVIRRALIRLLPFWTFAFLFKIGAVLHYTLLPVLGEQVFPVWAVGLLIGGASLIQLILDVPAGFLLDRFGYIRLLRISVIFFLCAAGVLLFGLNPVTYVLTALFSLLAWLFFGPGVDAYILLNAEKQYAGRYMALRDSIESGGVVIGMGVLALMIQLPTPVIGILLCIPLFLALVALGGAQKDRGSVHAEQKITHQSFYIRRHFIHKIVREFRSLNPVSVLLAISTFSASVFYGTVWFVVPLLMSQSFQHGVLSVGLMIFDFAALITGYAIGRMTDRSDYRWLVFWGLLIFSLSALFLGFNFGVLFVALGFLATTGDEMANISLWAWLDHVDTKHDHDGLLTGTMCLFQDAGWMIGPAIAGFLFEAVGPSWAIAAGGACIFLTWTITALVLFRSRVPFPELLNASVTPRRKRHKR